MEIKTADYKTYYDPSTQTVFFQGTLRLRGTQEYAPIVKLLDDVVGLSLSSLTLNLQALDFLNSSGIGVLSKFVIKIRKQGNMQLLVKGAVKIPWQEQFLKNLQRLMPNLQLELE